MHHINIKLENIDKQIQLKNEPFVDIFQGFPILDTADKRHVVDLIPPLKVDFQTGDLTLDLNSALSKILLIKKTSKKQLT